MKYEAICIGTSAGGIHALLRVLKKIAAELPQKIFIVQHIKRDAGTFFIENFDTHCQLPVNEAKDKEATLKAHVYVAPPGYHLLVNDDKTLSLSVDEPVNFSRPSIDVLFETAADVYGDKLIGIVLTGANKDGAAGLRTIKEKGGLTVVQDLGEAHVSTMPRAALEACETVDYILPLDEIVELINKLGTLLD